MKYILTVITLYFTLTCEGQTIPQVRSELMRQKVPHYEIVLAQVRLETGNFKSKLCKNKHNLFGIKHKGKYAHYSHWKHSISDYKKRISSRYKGGNYYDFLKRIGYAKDPNYIRKLKKIVNE